MKNAASLFAVALLASTSFADPRNPRPDWVDGASIEYPRAKYLVGVGSADDRQTAEDRARGEISKIFSTTVQVDTNITESETNVSKNGKNDNAFQQSVSQNVQTASRKALEDVQLVENWQDQATRQYYALAVLDRAKAIRAVNDKIGEFDKQAGQWKETMDKASDKLPRVKAALKLLSVLKARAELNSELRVLDESGKTVASPYDEAAIRPVASKAISELDVVLAMSGDQSKQVETGIIKGLSSFGLQAKKGSAEAEADITVEGSVDTKQMEGDGSKWRWARSTVTLSLKDGKTSKLITQLDLSDRQASADYSEAVRRTHVALAKKVAAQVNDAITSYFENQ